MIVKKHTTQDGRLVLAVCDADIIGKLFEEGSRQLDLCSGFYDGEELEDDKALSLMHQAYVINIAGKKAVRLAVGAGLVSEEQILRVGGVPNAQVVNVVEE